MRCRSWIPSLHAAALLALSLNVGCTGQISGAGGPGGSDCGDPSCFGTEKSAPSTEFPRLSHAQWENTVRDLLRLEARPGLASGFTQDPQGATYFDNDSAALETSSVLWGDYERAAERLAADVTGDATTLARILPTGLPADGEARVRGFVEGFGERAYRRPLTEAELGRYVALFDTGATHYPTMEAFAAGARLTIETMLQSPHFLYRVESGTARDGVVELDPFALASRLSYALWDSMPDDALFAAAEGGAIGDQNGLALEAARMLDDPRAEEKVGSFHRQLLELERYDRLALDGLSASAGSAMRDETERFIESVVFDEEGTLEELLTAPRSFANGETAAIYGVSGPTGDAMTAVDLDPAERAGLLTQPGFLASHAGDTAPILRGVFINLRILCADLPQPVAFQPPTLVGTTRRERIDSITGEGTCGATCHAQVINPLGFAFERFDDLGRFRAEDDGAPVDAFATYRFSDGLESFDGPVELAQLIARRPEAHECYVENWLEFAYGRSVEAGDVPIVRRIGHASRVDRLPVKRILVDLVSAVSFRTRAIPENQR